MRRTAGRGFTLLEVLVAFLIAAAALAAITRASGGGIAATRVAAQYDEAVARAQSHLALASALPLVASDRQGDEAGGFHWHVRISEAAATHAAHQFRSVGDGTITLYDIAVAVSWPEGGRLRTVQLDSARLGPVR